MSGAEVAGKAKFDGIRYAQCWEDADILVAGLDIQPGDICVSIASAGDNAIALLTKDPARVIAVDLSAAQLACVDLRVAAYTALDHQAFLEVYGARPSTRRAQLLQNCLQHLRDPQSRDFWIAREQEVTQYGFGGIGKFERYFRLFREWMLPIVHSRANVEALLTAKSRNAREAFFKERWVSWRWNALLGLFFSRTVMGALGRDPRFFDYVEGDLKSHLMRRVAHAAIDLDPAQNPYLHWIMTGTFRAALPLALREEHYETIRACLGRLEWRLGALEDAIGDLARTGLRPHRYNLSDIFEYMSEENTAVLLRRLAEAGAPGGRLAYWNMMVPRSRPQSLANQLRPIDARHLFEQDKAFFYRAFIVEEIV